MGVNLAGSGDMCRRSAGSELELRGVSRAELGAEMST